MPEDEIFQRIQLATDAAGLSFLLIGGHAVNAHGYQRTTIDLDLLAPESQRAVWKEVLAKQNYRLIHETTVFAQFDPPSDAEMNLDLMFVDDATFAKLAAARQMLPVGGAILPTPSVLHLIALKLHAARAASRATTGKDFQDALSLIRQHQIEVANPAFQEILSRYASAALRGRLLDALREGPG